MNPAVADILARTERLLDSDRLTEPTRRALKARYARRHGAPQVLDGSQMAVLRAAAVRLIPSDLAEVVDLPAAFDAALAQDGGDGWRYAELPPDTTLHREGLQRLDATARKRFGLGFAEVDGAAQDTLLTDAGEGRLDGPPGFDAARWFEELLSLLVELHYAHPAVQVEIGYDGMADEHGWSAVGLTAVAREAGGPA